MNGLWGNNVLRVGLGLFLGLAGIIYFNPPHTQCESQIEIYHDGFKNFQKAFEKNFRLCIAHPEPGGCVEFFEVTNKLESKLNDVSGECQQELAYDNVTKVWIGTSLEVFVRIAWGSQAPASYLYRNNWMEFSHIIAFCKIRKRYQQIFGEEALQKFSGNLLNDLPGSQELSSQVGRSEVWNRTLLSDPCNYGL